MSAKLNLRKANRRKQERIRQLKKFADDCFKRMVLNTFDVTNPAAIDWGNREPGSIIRLPN